jgi:hypothetical protein
LTTNLADSIELEYETGPEITINEDLTVWMRNESAFCVVFPADYSLKIFSKSEGRQFDNLINYIGDAPNYLRPKGDLFSERSIDIRPNTSGFTISRTTEFYAEVTGRLCKDENVVVVKKIPFIIAP